MTTSPRRALMTRRGLIPFPAYVPVTTFGDKYPLDDLVRPYLPRLAPAVMVSYHYARLRAEIADEIEALRVPVFVDSGGFVSLFAGACVTKADSVGVLELSREGGRVERIHPHDVLELQEQIADVAFTLDFPIPPSMDRKEAERRQQLTIANAHWAIANRRRKDLPLFACIQAWDTESARTCVRAYSSSKFDGLAIGGLVPRARDLATVRSIVEAVLSEANDRPVHVFGLGKPDVVAALFELGVASVDSSSYAKYAAEGRLWSDSDYQLEDPSPTDRLHLALCNLAVAASRALPLSTAKLMFQLPLRKATTNLKG